MLFLGNLCRNSCILSTDMLTDTHRSIVKVSTKCWPCISQYSVNTLSILLYRSTCWPCISQYSVNTLSILLYRSTCWSCISQYSVNTRHVGQECRFPSKCCYPPLITFTLSLLKIFFCFFMSVHGSKSLLNLAH